jgi:NAD(P)-dependent dehydrogenase (short-subunit alcohol dehydrogenase family)
MSHVSGGHESSSPVMLVAGGTGSIGSVIAAQALAAGWRVALHGRSDDSVAAALKALSADARADQVKGFAVDITEPRAMQHLVERAAAWAGRIDAVIDCISTGPAKRLAGAFADTEPEGYAAFMAMSVVNLQYLAHAALPHLKRGGGTLIAFASDAGRFAAPRQSLIGASRAGIMGFVRNLATEVAREGVRVHCVSPSFVDDTTTARHLAQAGADRLDKARRRAGLGLPTPADIAPLVLFLCGDGARRITGQVISVNGGLNA